MMAESFDLSKLLFGHVVLSSLAALSNAPAWDIPVALYGLAIQPLDGPHAGETGRTFVAVTGLSFILDLVWFVSNSTHGFARILILLNFLLKPVTIMSALSHLRSNGESGFSFQGSIPAGLAERIPGSFPPFGHRQQGSETVFSAPGHSQPPGGYQTRFSLDDDLEANSAGGSGASTPAASIKKGSTGAAAGSGAGAGKSAGGGAPGQGAGGYGSGNAAEGGGYHSLE
ncbi:hypothetical protein JCM10207_002380 [Rhodosporidiobolus poonsookiae]